MRIYPDIDMLRFSKSTRALSDDLMLAFQHPANNVQTEVFNFAAGSVRSDLTEITRLYRFPS